MRTENTAVTTEEEKEWNPPFATDIPRSGRTVRKALVKFPRELIEELLHFPSGKILSMRDSHREGEFELLVESPDFEPVRIGDQLPHRVIYYTTTKDKGIVESRWS